MFILNELKFYKEHPDAITPTEVYSTDAGLDIYSIEEKIIPAKGFAKVANGLRIMIPVGVFAEFRTRSSMGFMKNILVYGGTLDSNFSGNLDILLYNFSKEDYTVKKGDRYAQLVLHYVPPKKLIELTKEQFEKETENARGFWGSSGR
jgi:deoxyuridine 5'-triphosphate nucleotidohydrolase